MDQASRDISQDIRHIGETRQAISTKLALLERRIQDTIESMKSTVEQTFGHVRQTAKGVVDHTIQTFDPIPQVREHPWAMVGGALLVGYVLGKLESAMPLGRQASGASLEPREQDGRPASGQPSSDSNLWQQVSQEISGEIEQAKQAGIEAGRTFVQNLVQRTLVRHH